MERCVVYLCGLWFWLTRRWRVVAYSEAAATLELAHAYLLRDYFSYASTRDRGRLLPFHDEALAILQNHAIETYVTATRMASLRQCCQFVAEELGRLNRPVVTPNPRPAPIVLRPAPAYSYVARRFSPSRVLQFAIPRVTTFGRLLTAEMAGSIWDRRPLQLAPSHDGRLRSYAGTGRPAA